MILVKKDFISQVVLVWIWGQTYSNLIKWVVKMRVYFSHVCKHMCMWTEGSIRHFSLLLRHFPLLLSNLFFKRRMLPDFELINSSGLAGWQDPRIFLSQLLYCWDGRHGRLHWAFYVGTDWGFSSNPYNCMTTSYVPSIPENLFRQCFFFLIVFPFYSIRDIYFIIWSSLYNILVISEFIVVLDIHPLAQLFSDPSHSLTQWLCVLIFFLNSLRPTCTVWIFSDMLSSTRVWPTYLDFTLWETCLSHSQGLTSSRGSMARAEISYLTPIPMVRIALAWAYTGLTQSVLTAVTLYMQLPRCIFFCDVIYCLCS